MKRALLLAGVLGLVHGCGKAVETGPERPRAVVLVVIDALRADHVGALGPERKTTPELDALAAEGLLFERAYAGSSNALQSLATLWTARLPTAGGSTGLYQAAPHADAGSLPRLFLRAGFRTALAGNVAGLRARGFTRGFDELEVDSVPGRWNAERVTAAALDLVDAAAGEPLFLTVAYGDAAEPHLPAPEWRRSIDVPEPEEYLSLPGLRASAGELPDGIRASAGLADLVARYDAELAYVDSCLGALVRGLAERGLRDDTLLVVTSARGVEFLEHGYVGSGWTVHEEVVRVPLLFHAPGLVRPARESAPVSLADVLPTLASVLDLPLADDALDGTPILGPRSGELTPLPRSGAVLTEVVVPELAIVRACIAGDTKLVEAVRWIPPAERASLEAGYDTLLRAMLDGEVERPDPLGEPARIELFDLARDPAEARDLATAGDARVARLRTWLERYREACRTHGLAAPTALRPATPPDPEAAEDLRALGYL